MDRKKNAQELLKWKKMLDAEEERVYKLEKKALKGCLTFLSFLSTDLWWFSELSWEKW